MIHKWMMTHEVGHARRRAGTKSTMTTMRNVRTDEGAARADLPGRGDGGPCTSPSDGAWGCIVAIRLLGRMKTTIRPSIASAMPLLLLLSPRPSPVVPFPTMKAVAVARGGRRRVSSRAIPSATATSFDDDDDGGVSRTTTSPPPPPPPSLQRLLSSYSFHWEDLLRREHQEAVSELQHRRRSYTRSQLEASGLSIFDAVASPETELYGEKIVRISIRDGAGDKRLREKFKRGDALVMTPQATFRGKDVAPREGLVMDVQSDHLTLGVGSSWPAGVMEMRKHHDNYGVRLDRSPSSVPLRAQRAALEGLRKGEAGDVAELLVRSFYEGRSALKEAADTPAHFEGLNGELDGMIDAAMEEAAERANLEPNASQREAIRWALSRKLGCIRGPPGTGKTRCSALLISTALKILGQQRSQLDAGEISDEDGEEPGPPPRILAVTHSNGAADVLLQALVQMGVPAVRAGRPASVGENVRHRTIAALSERMPEVQKLRQQAGDATLDKDVRSSAFNDAKRCQIDAQTTIARSAPVVVASCVGAAQLSSMLSGEGDGFSIVVLDEAGQTTEPGLICALAASGAGQAILVGDTRQLPPTVAAQDVQLRKDLSVSPMERLLKNGVEEYVLREQYRMPPSLLRHPNEYFYDGVVKCAVEDSRAGSPPEGFPWPSPDEEPLAFLEMGNDSEVAHNFGGRTNPSEAEVIVDIVKKVIAAGDVAAKDIAIITPYSKQVQLLRNELGATKRDGLLLRGKGDDVVDASSVRVGTVDSFQGQETDLVLFSAVRSNPLRELGFLRDERRLNVAITRARRGLIVVGDPRALRTCRHWSALLESCSSRGCTLTLDDYNSHRLCVDAADDSKESPEEGLERRLSDVKLDKDDVYFGLFSSP